MNRDIYLTIISGFYYIFEHDEAALKALNEIIMVDFDIQVQNSMMASVLANSTPPSLNSSHHRRK